MATQDWFRSPSWNEDARADFEARLGRSRAHSRPQYLKIKALALQGARETAAAKGLFQRVLDEHPTSLDAAQCAEALGGLAMAEGKWTEAEDRFRLALKLRPDMNATSGEVHIRLAESLSAQSRFDDALKALDYVPVAKLGLNHSHCRWNAALAEAALGAGEQRVAAAAAERALALLDAPDQFSRHKGVGRAQLSTQQVERLGAIARGDADRPKPRRWFSRRA